MCDSSLTSVVTSSSGLRSHTPHERGQRRCTIINIYCSAARLRAVSWRMPVTTHRSSSWALGEQFVASVPKPRWVTTLGWQELEGRGCAARRLLTQQGPLLLLACTRRLAEAAPSRAGAVESRMTDCASSYREPPTPPHLHTLLPVCT